MRLTLVVLQFRFERFFRENVCPSTKLNNNEQQGNKGKFLRQYVMCDDGVTPKKKTRGLQTPGTTFGDSFLYRLHVLRRGQATGRDAMCDTQQRRTTTPEDFFSCGFPLSCLALAGRNGSPGLFAGIRDFEGSYSQANMSVDGIFTL